MKTRDRYLSAVLLVVIGILIGTIISLYQQEEPPIRADVNVTDIRRDTSRSYFDTTGASLSPRYRMKQVVEKVRPAVVYIESEVDGRQRRFSSRPDEGSGSDLLDEFMPERKINTVGSGVIISPDGFILTNNHVIKGADDDGISVTLYDKRSFRARIVGTDPSTDLAVLKIPPSNLPSITVGDSDKIDVGEWVLAVGNPFRLKSTVTAGIVSALHRNVQIINVNNDLRVESFIQTDAAINKGNSGGALVNTDGRLIGINTAIASQSGTYQGYGFAVPANLAIKVAQDLIEFGEVRRALLGIRMEPINYERSKELGLAEVTGVEVVQVMEESAAALAGIQEKDAILRVDGHSIGEPNELQQEIAEHRPGDQITLTLWRNSEQLTKNVTLKSVDQTADFLSTNEEENTDQPSSRRGPHQFQSYEFGLEVMSVESPDESSRQKLVITKVFRGSRAWRAGLRRGGVIERVDGKKVVNLEDFNQRLDQSLEDDGKVKLFVELENHTAQNYVLERK